MEKDKGGGREDERVICRGTQKLEDFIYRSKPRGKYLKSLSIRYCVLSDENSLDKFVRKIGIRKTRSFSFQSFKGYNKVLTRRHFKAITEVKELNLSNNFLVDISSEVFADFPDLEKLDLSHNNLKQLNDTFDTAPNLKYLDLSNNIIFLMSPTLFYKLTSLEHLILGTNPTGDIHGDAFDNLLSLKSLNLNRNKMSDLDWDIFGELKNVETIDISNNNFVSIPRKLFNGTRNLRKFVFENNTSEMETLPEYLLSDLDKLEEISLRNNGFINLPDNFFWKSLSLKYINLEDNSITQLNHIFFKGLKNLEVLKINNNLIEIIPIGIFNDLEKLRILDMSMNIIDVIPRGVFKGLTSLTELNMENNRLKYFEKETFIPLEKLSIVKFSNNLLDFKNETNEWSPFYYNKNLTELHLSNNSIHTFFTDWTLASNLTFLNLTHNNISYLSMNNLRIKSDQILVDLRHNNISNIILSAIEALTIYQVQKRDVKVLVDYNPISCDCELYNLIRYFNKKMPFSVYNYIEIVVQDTRCIRNTEMYGPKIKEIDSATYLCPEDKYFKVDTNCPIDCTCSLRIADKTRIIDCSNKSMTFFVINQFSEYFVNSFPVILNLTGNALTRLPLIEPPKPIELTGLLLSNNRITELTVEKLPETLHTLELHNNSISRLEPEVLEHLGIGFLKNLTLSGNPIICDCEIDKLLTFLEVICKDTEMLDDFIYRSNSRGKTINSLSIRSCVLSDTFSLDRFVRKLGVVQSEFLSFQSFKANNRFLTRGFLNGISNVKEFVLSHNSFVNISNEFFADFPELVKLDLSHNNLLELKDIFDVIPKLKYLDLSYNLINSMSSTLFYKLENLEYLNLGYNPIGFILGSTFDKQISLKNLNLRATNKHPVPISSDLFKELKNVETIDISYNSFISIPKKLFNENINLRKLFFHNIYLDLYTLPDDLFSHLEKLEEFYLHSDRFLKLPDNLFWNSPLLKYIHLGNNSITKLNHTFFQGLKNLEVLKINNNLIEIIPIGIFKDLEELKLLDLSMNRIHSIPRGVFEGLTSLTELNMENNLLKYIDQEAFIPIKKLTIAKLSNNRLYFSKETDDWSLFFSNEFLEELHLSNNSIQTFSTDWTIGYNLKFFNLSHNYINTLSIKNVSFHSNKALIDLRYNNITNIVLIGIEALARAQNEKREVKVLIDHNPILCDCYLYKLIRYFHNELPTSVYNYVEFVAKNLSCIHSDGTMGPKIEELNSATYICLEEHYFKKNTHCPIGCKCNIRLNDKTRILDCSNKNMSFFVIGEQYHYNEKTFPVILNLTGNALTKIPSMEFSDPIKLTGLLLSNNRISEITIDELPPTLQVLELHNNRISRIDYSVLKHLSPSMLHDLTLSGNPIICDCNVEALLVFVKFYRSTFTDLMKLKCEEMNTPLYNTELVDFCPLVDEIIEGGKTIEGAYISINYFYKFVILCVYSEVSTYMKLKKLETIDLSYNSFDNIAHIFFKENENLKQIFFHNIKIDSYTLPDYLFSNLQKLEEIYLNDNGFLTLPNNLFQNSTSLKYINLGNNSINQLYDTFFEGLKNLEVLKINNNSIKVISKGIFKDLEKLKLLDLSMNYIDSIPKDIFEGLTSLTELNMDNNLLKHIDQETFIPLEYLSIAKFSNNLLHFASDFTRWSPFHFNKFLKELHLSNNSIHRFFPDWTTSSSLIFLNLTHNHIRYLSLENVSFKSNKTLVDLRYNNISNIFLEDIELTALFQMEKRDVKVLIDHNPILCNCNLYNVIRYFHNEMPYFVYNYIEFVTQNFSCIYTNGTMGPKIEKLNSTTYTCAENEYFKMDTRCPTICTCSVRISDKTRLLDCSNKNMSSFVFDDETQYFVNRFPVILNLTGNALWRMPLIFSLKPINVTGLLLSNNRISEIRVENLPRTLKTLELHNNSISRIGFNVIKHLNSSLLTELTLSGNPILCDCGVEALFNFVNFYRFAFKDLNELKCKKPNIPIYTVKLTDICP
ncbi:hypothetical protein M0802_006394 [Mischocyttarus mexicanus]|nr:hypothetical protein M0802_006394 [Mischocyttarus mexicanus]